MDEEARGIVGVLGDRLDDGVERTGVAGVRPCGRLELDMLGGDADLPPLIDDEDAEWRVRRHPGAVAQLESEAGGAGLRQQAPRLGARRYDVATESGQRFELRARHCPDRALRLEAADRSHER